MKKNTKKILSFLAVFFLLTNLFLPSIAQAYSFSIPSWWSGQMTIDQNQILQGVNNSGLSSITSQLENRYGINQNVWRTAQRKEDAPRVEMFFDNTNPKPGEKVTAHAVPEFFKNDPKNLYYTWYIIHTKDGTIKTATNTIRDGKIEAAGIMARGDYDPNLDGQTYANPDSDPDKDGWPPTDKYDPGISAAPMGGSDGVGGLEDGSENIEPYKDANAYCDTQGKHALSDCNLYTNKNAFNQYYNLTPSQTGNYCKSCASSTQFSVNLFSSSNQGNCQPGSVAEKLGLCQTPTSSIAPPNNQCCYSILYPDPADPNYLPYDPNVSYCPTAYISTYENCYDYAGLQAYNSNLITSCLDTQYQSCLDNWNGIHTNPSGNEPVSQVSRCYKHNFGVNNPDLGFRGFNGSSNGYSSDNSGTDAVTDCTHKWPNMSGYKSGSGKFTTREEQFWKTDPTNPDTDGDGISDGAAIIGLGHDTFTWDYQPGDRVGVVVEGTSLIPVDELSAYYKIMWGYLDTCDSTKKDLMDNDECDSSDDYGYGFLATQSPSEQGDSRLKVSLSFSPDNPLADPSNDNKDNIASDGTITDADQITVTSSLDNTDYNPNNLYYTWQIQKGNPQTNDWGNALDIPSNFSTTSPSAGMGISQFSFSPKTSALDSNTGINYFKVTLTLGKASDLKAGTGQTNVILPVNTKGIKIVLHKVDIQNGKAVVGDEICNSGLYQSLCPVVKGQMLAAQVSGSHYTSGDSQFSWTVDDSPVYPPANVADLFNGWNNTTIFFPITKDEQQIENVSVTATSKTDLQPATGTRSTTVVHPAVFINSGDTSLSWPKTYTAPDQNQIAVTQNIQSSDAFQALASSTAPYYLDFVPYYLLASDANSQINWSVNGTDITSPDFYANNPTLDTVQLDNNGQTIKLPISAIVGTFTTLSASVKKYWSNEERGIAYSAWGVALDTLSGDSSVSIESVSEASPDVVGTSNDPGQILAAVSTHLPHYFMYLLRLVLTMVVMFVVSAGFYGLTQKLSLFNEEE